MKEALQTWRETAPAAARCEAAKTAIKAVLPDDVGRVRYPAPSWPAPATAP
jgi:hypothetical protein